jgi:hypothetical protein
MHGAVDAAASTGSNAAFNNPQRARRACGSDRGAITTLVDQMTPEAWRSHAAAFADNNLYQSWAFAERRASETGCRTSRMMVMRGDDVIGMAHARVKRIPLFGSGVAYIYRGPMWRRSGADLDDFRSVVDAIRREYTDRRGLAVRVAPNVLVDCDRMPSEADFAAVGFSPDPGVTPDRTIFLDLSPSLEAIEAGLNGKWRNCLRRGRTGGSVVRVGGGDRDFGVFAELYEEMWKGKRFETGVSVASMRAIQEALPEPDRLGVLLAYVDDRPVAGLVATLLGDTSEYVLGASNEEGRDVRASYLLQWTHIERAKQAGMRWYDLGGIDEVNNPGVTHFKRGIGGTECSFLGAMTAPAPGAGRFLVRFAERAYRALRGRRSANP